MDMSGLNSFNFCSCSFCSLHMNHKKVLSICSLDEKLKRSLVMVKTIYYHINHIRGRVQRRQGHSRFYMASAVILKSLFHIHLTPQVFSVLAGSLFDHKFLLTHAAMLLCLARAFPLRQQRAKPDFYLLSTPSVNKKPVGNECMSTCSGLLCFAH